MNQHPIWTVIFALVASTAAKASMPDMPKRKAGLWDIKMENEQTAKRPISMQQCIDEKTDATLQQKSMQAEQKNCEQKSFSSAANGWDYVMVCKRAEGTTTMHAVASGDFSASYQVDMTITMDPPRNGRSEMKNLMKFKYQGACGADMQAGDMIMNGMKISGMGTGQAMSKADILKKIEQMRQQRGNK